MKMEGKGNNVDCSGEESTSSCSRYNDVRESFFFMFHLYCVHAAAILFSSHSNLTLAY